MNAGDALVVALTPQTRAQMVEWAGGRGEAARQVAGLPADGPLPAAGTDERRAYTTARRNFEGKRLDSPISLRLAVIGASARIAKMRSRGARAKLYGIVKVSDDITATELPKVGPGQFLSRQRVQAFTGPFLRGNFDEAGARFIDVFLAAYQFDFAEIGEITWLKVWPDGDDEPD